MDWLNKRVRLKPGVDPTDRHIGIVVSQLNPYQVKVNWGGTTSHEYIYVLEAVPDLIPGDIVSDLFDNPIGLILLVKDSQVVVIQSNQKLAIKELSEVRKLNPK